MKHIKTYIMLVLVALTTMGTMTACLGDESDNNAISAEEYRQAMSSMAGSYNGKIRFYRPKTTYAQQYEKYDSTYTTWRVSTDSTITVRQFPVSKLDSAIVVPATDNSPAATKALTIREAISKASPKDIKAYFYIPNKNFIVDSGIQFYVNPYVVEVPVTYDGSNHTLYFAFTSNYCGGAWTKAALTFEFNMQLYAICVDNANEASKISSTYVRNAMLTCTAK